MTNEYSTTTRPCNSCNQVLTIDELNYDLVWQEWLCDDCATDLYADAA